MPEPVTSLVRVAVESDAPQQLVSRRPCGARQAARTRRAGGRARSAALPILRRRRPRARRSPARPRRAAWSRRPGGGSSTSRAPSSPFGYLAIGERNGRRGSEPGARRTAVRAARRPAPADRPAARPHHRAPAATGQRRGGRAPRVPGSEAATSAGSMLADAYWPAMLGWRGQRAAARGRRGDPSRAARLRSARRARADAVRANGAASSRRRSAALDWFHEVAARAGRLAPSARPAGDRRRARARLADLGAGVAELDALWRMGPRDEATSRSCRCATTRSTACSPARPTRPEAAEFVRQQIGPLIAWDRQHQADYLTVLEAGLDVPRHDVAAARCFMHRNTFRHRFRHATTILGDTPRGSRSATRGAHRAQAAAPVPARS